MQPQGRMRLRGWLGLALLALSLVAGGCSPRRHVARAGEDPFDRITIARFDSLVGSARQTRDLPRNAYRKRPVAATRRALPRARSAAVVAVPAHIHPLLLQWVKDSLGTKLDTLLVTFRDNVPIPRFPEPDMSRPRNAPPNIALLDEARALRDSLLVLRAPQYDADSLDLALHYDARVLERFWLGQVFRVLMPLDHVLPLASRPGVLYIGPVHSGERAPQGGAPTPTSGDEVSVARKRIVSDPYFNWPPIRSYGWMSLLDTGVQFTHELLRGGAHIGIQGDCVNCLVNSAGKTDCVTPDPGKPFMPYEKCAPGHGTSSAAIIVGDATRGDPYRGVTEGILDCFRVYEGCPATLNSAAVLHGLQDAVINLDRVICAEVAADSTDLSAISIFADHAYEAGATVIASNGNKTNPLTGTGTKVKAPAYARKVIGVGGYEITLSPPATILGQTWGPTEDGRAKPDIQAPSNSETAMGAAGPGPTTSSYWTYTGTSGATPYAAGAAALLRNWLHWASGTTDPGQVYAQLILSGRQLSPFTDAKVGAGPIELPTDGWGAFGKGSFDPGTVLEIPLDVTGLDIRRIEAAVWWPEELVTDPLGNRQPSHNVIQLTIWDPAGNLRASSEGALGVFQRASADNTQGPGEVWAGGTWKLLIVGEVVPHGPQTVYWTAALRR